MPENALMSPGGALNAIAAGVTPRLPQTGLEAGRNALEFAQGLQQMTLQAQQIAKNKAQQEVGRLFSESVDPATGRWDVAKFTSGLQANPDTAWFAQEGFRQSAAAQAQQLANHGLELEQAIKLSTVGASRANELLRRVNADGSPQKITADDLRAMVSDIYGDPELGMPAKLAVKWIGSIPQNGTDTQNRNFLRQVLATSEGMVQNLLPSFVALNTGAQTITRQSNPVVQPGAVQTMMQPVQQELSPEALTQQVQIVNPETGQASTIPRAEAMRRQGIGPTGRLGAGTYPGRELPTSMEVGAPQFRTAQAEQGAEQSTALTKAVSQLGAQRNTLDRLEALAGEFSSGPISEGLAKVGGTLQQLGLDTSKMTDNATAYQEFNKYAQQLVNSQLSQLGASGTDQKLLSIVEATPNAKMTPEAIKTLIGFMQGTLDYTQAENTAWQQYQANPPAGTNAANIWQRFIADWNKNAAPDLWQVMRLPRDKQAEYYKSLSESEKKKFLERGDWAHKMGLI